MILAFTPEVPDRTRRPGLARPRATENRGVSPTRGGTQITSLKVPVAFKPHSSMSCKPGVQVKPHAVFAEEFQLRTSREAYGAFPIMHGSRGTRTRARASDEIGPMLPGQPEHARIPPNCAGLNRVVPSRSRLARAPQLQRGRGRRSCRRPVAVLVAGSRIDRPGPGAAAADQDHARLAIAGEDHQGKPALEVDVRDDGARTRPATGRAAGRRRGSSSRGEARPGTPGFPGRPDRPRRSSLSPPGRATPSRGSRGPRPRASREARRS